MLSILIPVKNFDCSRLIAELHRQGEVLGVPYEILIAEDGTESTLLHLNKKADKLSNCRRIVKKDNIKRAGIRNLLAAEAQYPYLIFIDSDAIVEKDDFLAMYATAMQSHQVVCGGLYHADTIPNTLCTLRYRYEKEADRTRDAQTRNKAPYDRFTSFNLGTENHLSLLNFAGVHLLEQLKALLDGTVAVWTVCTRLCRSTFLLGNLLGCLLVNICLALLDELDGEIPKLVKVVRSVIYVRPDRKSVV